MYVEPDEYSRWKDWVQKKLIWKKVSQVSGLCYIFSPSFPSSPQHPFLLHACSTSSAKWPDPALAMLGEWLYERNLISAFQKGHFWPLAPWNSDPFHRFWRRRCILIHKKSSEKKMFFSCPMSLWYFTFSIFVAFFVLLFVKWCKK